MWVVSSQYVWTLIIIVWLITVFCVWQQVRFLINFLVVRTSTLCGLFFLRRNWFWVFVFYEIRVFPILFLIILFGTQFDRLSAASYMFIYTTCCSAPFLRLVANMGADPSFFTTFILFLVFAVKFPVYFLHLWLPKAHVEAPTVASVLLARIILKLGSVGFLKALEEFSPKWFSFEALIFFLGVLGIVICDFIASVCRDVKITVAYSSIVHISMVMVSLNTSSSFSISGRLVMIIAHGYISSVLFYFVGMFYHRLHTRNVYFISGLMRVRTFLRRLTTLGFSYNFSLPPSLGFLGEVFMIVGTSFLFFGVVLALIVYVLVSCYFSVFTFINMLTGLRRPLVFEALEVVILPLLLFASNLIMCIIIF